MPWDQIAVGVCVAAAAAYLVIGQRRKRGSCGGCENACGPPSDPQASSVPPRDGELIQLEMPPAAPTVDPTAEAGVACK